MSEENQSNEAELIFAVVLSTGMEMQEDGNIKFQTEDGKGRVGTIEDLEKGLLSFGKDVSTEEILYRTGGNIKEPVTRAIREFLEKDENREFFDKVAHLNYIFRHEDWYAAGAKKNEPVVVEEAIVYETVDFSGEINDQARKLIRRLCNKIENNVVETTNNSIHMVDIVRIQQDANVFTIRIKRSEVSSYSFTLGVG